MKWTPIPRDLKRNIKVTKKVLEDMKFFRSQGFSYRRIAEKLSISYASVYRWLQTPEKQKAEREKSREYLREYSRKISKDKRNRIQKETREYRKIILPNESRIYTSYQNTKQRYKNYNGKKLFQVMEWHKQQIANLLEIEPLLILIKSKDARIEIKNNLCSPQS